MNRAILNLENGEIKKLDNFICFNLDVKPIDDENEEIKITKYVSTNMDINQNKFSNLCVAGTCEEIIKELKEIVNASPEKEQKKLMSSEIDSFCNIKNITLKDEDNISIVRMGVCFEVIFKDENISINVYPTRNLKTIEKLMFVLELITENINYAFEKYKELYHNIDDKEININKI